MSFLKDLALENKKGEQQSAQECLKNASVLGLYFAADWCPDCRDFQPTLNKFYEQVNATDKQLEIVFVGSDRTKQDQVTHFQQKQGSWWMIPFEHEQRNALKRRYGVCAGKEKDEVGVTDRKNGIPSLVIVNGATGDLIDLHGAENIAKEGKQALHAWTK